MWKNNNTKMHGLSDIGPNVPAFLIKLWKLVNDPETDELIWWSESGMSFIINQPAQFARELLSLYYKHNNMASFIRQLNMYGFHKIVSDAGGLKNEKDCMEFAHQYFIKDHPYLLENIKRKLPNPKSSVISNEQFTNTNVKNGTQSEILAKVLSDVNNLKGKQESWDAKLAAMKRENEALWRELAIFRQKHLKQEQIINRLIHFIVTIVQPSRNVPLRRRYPLMLNDIQPVKKITKLSGADTSNISQGSPTGPTIHEIDTTDVLFGSPEQSQVPANDVEFISSDLAEGSPKFIEVENADCSGIEKGTTTKSSNDETVNDSTSDDWLEIQMTEGDPIDPLTPIDPAKVNPAVAAATLKHLEGTNKIGTPIAITIPSFSDSGKRNPTEKKIIYLTDINSVDRSLRKNNKKSVVAKLDVNKKSLNNTEEDAKPSSSTNLLFDLVSKSDDTSPKIVVTTAKRKLSTSKPLPSIPKVMQTQKKIVKKADSESCVPELEIDDLAFLLTAKQPDDVAESRGSESTEKTSSIDPSFLKLDSLYNGTISEDQLGASSDKTSIDLNIVKTDEVDPLEDAEGKLSATGLVNAESLSSKDEHEDTGSATSCDPESMAVVCQQSPSSDNIARELNSHVDTVQGELDYLKEMLKGEGYNFDPNSLPWLFNDDPLSYGVFSSMDEDVNQKKNDETEISGNELMTYGTPSLMDMVDMIGLTPSNQDWTNALSPTTPTVTDLVTPAPSPNPFSFPTASKRRKK